MLYGNIIFIKKTGGDGSKFPVTERNIKIGRSEKCLIQIYNPQVEPEHCELIIEENGQAILRNLSNQTILNGKPFGHKNAVLCHGDIFKLGERLARWEYLPTSKYYKQLLSPTGRLVAVVMPQQRPLVKEITPRASVSQFTVSKNTPLGKRRFSERATGEKSVAKIRKSNDSELIYENRDNLSKFLTGCDSLKSTKFLLKNAKPKERKSISGIIISSKTTKEKVGKKKKNSNLPLWDVNIASPPGKTSPADTKCLKISYEKSAKLLENVKTPSKDTTKSKSFEKYLSVSKTKMKKPRKALIDSKPCEEVLAPSFRGVLKTPSSTTTESPSNSGRKSLRSKICKKSTLSLKLPSNFVESTPKPKFPKFTRLVYSESKINSTSVKQSELTRGNKRITSTLEKVKFTPKKNLKMNLTEIPNKTLHTRVNNSRTNQASEAKKNSPGRNSSLQKTIIRSKASIKISSAKETSKSAVKVQDMGTPTENPVIITPASGTEKRSRTSRIRNSKIVASGRDPLSINLNTCTDPKDSYCRNDLYKNISLKNTQCYSPDSFNRNETLLSSLLSPIDKTLPNLNSVRSSQRRRKFSLKKIEAVALISQTANPSIARIISPRGIERKLSPSSSAERAANKLKTSCPRKPDKNKKAALLVLGKANRKQLVSKNFKVLLKQKIVKKALKQSNGVFGHKDESRKKISCKTKQDLNIKIKPKINSKTKKSAKIYKSSKKDILPLTTSDASALSVPVQNIAPKGTLKGIKVLDETHPINSNILQTPFSSPDNLTEATSKSFSNQHKQLGSSCEMNGQTISLSTGFEKNAENYLINSFCRCSKRLSSKNDTGRPDFTELSPTALGLIPKNLDIFRTPKDKKKRSSSLATPKNLQTAGIIKSASTSKIGNNKSVRFSPKGVSYNSAFSSPKSSEKIEFDFSSFNTPNITMDVFVSPLSEKSIVTEKEIDESKILLIEKEISNSSSKNSRSPLDSKLYVRKLLKSPQPKKSIDVTSNERVMSCSSKTPVTQLSSEKVTQFSESYLSDFEGVQGLLETPKTQKTQKSLEISSSDVKKVTIFLQTRKVIKSPKMGLKNFKKVEEYLQTPKMQRTLKNDLKNVRGVKKLLRTPKVQKSPRNDLTDVRGVKKLLRTPKMQKSPRNDLTDVRGVKKLLRTPKVQKSPRNDLTDVRGVKKLLRTPKMQKSPRNDLTDVRGVKKLLRTPKMQKRPRNDLTDVRGVKKLLRTPKMQKSPRNDLTDVRGVKKLLRTPKMQKSPRNDLTDVRGVKKLLRTPKMQKSPRNDLTDVRGVKKLLRTPKVQKSPRNDLTDVRGVKKLLRTPKMQKSPRNDLTDVRGVKKLLRTPKMQKSPRNDLLNVLGVRELLLKHQPTSDCILSLTGVTKLFNLSPDVPKQAGAKSGKKSNIKMAEIKSLRPRKVLRSEDKKDEGVKMMTRGSKLKREETEKKATKNSKLKAAELKEKKIAKRKVEKTSKKASAVKRTSQKVTQMARKAGVKFQDRTTMKSENNNIDIKNSRKRKASDVLELSSYNLRRKLPKVEKSNSDESKGTVKRSLLESKSKSEKSGRKISVKSAQKVSENLKNKKKPEASSKVQMKKTFKAIGTKQTQKVQSKRSGSKSRNIINSEQIVSPRKTRSVKMKAISEKISVNKITSTDTAIMKKSSPAVKRSTRRKI